jgi:DNA-binding CsgD family transcriptional regulator
LFYFSSILERTFYFVKNQCSKIRIYVFGCVFAARRKNTTKNIYHTQPYNLLSNPDCFSSGKAARFSNAIISLMFEPGEPLSERELEILRLVSTGAANKEIARQLVISPNTVKVHVRNIFAKIGVSSRTEAALYALKIGLVKQVETVPAGEEFVPQQSALQAGPLLENGSRPEVEQVTSAVSPVTEPGLPGIVIEEMGGQGSQARALPFLRGGLAVGLIILAALILISIGVMSARLIPRLTPTPVSTAVPLAASASSQPRWSAKTHLPDVRVGMGIVAYDNTFYLIGGETAQGPDGALLRYMPKEDTWESLASKTTPVSHVQAAMVGEKIYVPGGLLKGGKQTNIMEVYDPRQNTWETRAPLPLPLSDYALASFEGRLYLFGGLSEKQYSSAVYEYDPETNHWQERSKMSSPRAYASAVVIGEEIHILGGYDGKKALVLHEGYFPTRDAAGDNAWEQLTPLPEGRYAMGTTQLAGTIFLLGGLDGKEGVAGEHTPAVPLEYQTQADQWGQFDAPPIPVQGWPALQAYGNYLFLFGGETPDGPTAATQAYQAIFTVMVPLINAGGK